MDASTFAICALILLALIFCFSNGFHDSSGLVASMISTRAIPPDQALVMATVFEFLGACLLGTAVARTMMTDLLDARAVMESAPVTILAGALLAALGWNILTWYFGMPSSSSHALIGGLVGSFIAKCGFLAVPWEKLITVLIVLVASPLLGFLVAYLVTKMSYFCLQWSGPKVGKVFNRLHVFSACLVAFSHGTNDGQKTMGVIALVLAVLVPQAATTLSIPFWVQLVSAITISFGVLMGGWKLIKTLGFRLYRMRPIHGFVAQSMSFAVLCGMSLLGYPLSSTQVISSSVLGAGAADRPKAIRWLIVRDMVMTWIITLPASALMAAGWVWLVEVLRRSFY